MCEDHFQSVSNFNLDISSGAHCKIWRSIRNQWPIKLRFPYFLRFSIFIQFFHQIVTSLTMRGRGGEWNYLRRLIQCYGNPEFHLESYWNSNFHTSAFCEIWGKEVKGKNNRFVINDLKNFHFHTSLDSSDRVNFAHLGSQIFKFDPNTRPNPISSAIFANNDWKHAHLHTFINFFLYIKWT